MNLSVGILIVGSLYWDSAESREQWRAQRLVVAASKSVFAPIRYGRRSRGREDSYTMVYSPALCHDVRNLGRAVAVPCCHAVHSAEDLFKEAEYLWAAERKSSKPNGCVSATWGCVCLAANPAREIPPSLLADWSNRIAREHDYGKFSGPQGEGPIVLKSGLLNICWPMRTDGHPLELDLMLATATKPSIIDGRYPNPSEIAGAWKGCSDPKQVDYFWCNRNHNIVTFEDADIEQLLKDGASK